MKRIIYVLLMMLPVMASAQVKNEEDARNALRGAIIKAFNNVAHKAGDGGYSINGKVERYSVVLASFRNGFTFSASNGNEYPISVKDSDAVKQMEKIGFVLNEFCSLYDNYYRFVPKSYNVLVRSREGIDLDTVRIALGITPKENVKMSDIEGTFREYLLFDFKKGSKEDPYYNSVSVEYKMSKTDEAGVYYASFDDMAELKGMVSDYIKTLKGYKMKSYSVSYEYSGDYKETKDAMPTFNYFGGSFVGVKTTGKHYVIPMSKEEILSNSSAFINKMIEKAKVLGAMSLTTEIDPTVKIMDDSQCQDLLLTHTYIWDEKKHTSKFYNVVLGFDEKGLHILEAECNNYANPIPMMWMNIKTLYNDKVKWEKGLEP